MLEAPVGQIKQPTIAQQDEEGEPEHPAHNPRVPSGTSSKAPVERTRKNRRVDDSPCVETSQPTVSPTAAATTKTQAHAAADVLVDESRRAPEGQGIPSRGQAPRNAYACRGNARIPPCPFGRSSIAARAGLRVSELNVEIKVEVAMVSANWRKNWPTIPLMKAQGRRPPRGPGRWR